MINTTLLDRGSLTPMADDFEPTALPSFDQLYRAEIASITGVVYAICGNRWVAEDLAHDAFVIAHRHWSRIADYESPAAFVRRVAMNLARSRVRRFGAEARALTRYALRHSVPTPSLEVTDMELWTVVRRLPRRQSEVVVLRYVADLSDAQIADVLGCSEQTVRVHAHRAKLALGDLLGERWRG